MNVKNSEKGTGFFVFIVFLGGITGSLIGDIVGANVKTLGFLKTVYSVGTTQPLYLNLKVIGITLGFNFNLNIMSIIGIILAIILFRKY
jgi:hypothetical protein